MGDTAIEYVTKSWNPMRGCSMELPCAKRCWARQFAHRQSGKPGYGGFTDKQGNWTGKVALIEKHLTEPMSWREPQRVAGAFMGDLFHESLPDAAIDQIFAVMALCPQHWFLVLTKRSKRMREYFADSSLRRQMIEVPFEVLVSEKGSAQQQYDLHKAQEAWSARIKHWPLPNVALGLSCLCQKDLNDGLGDLLAAPAALRFLSLEPLLARVNLGLLGTVEKTISSQHRPVHEMLGWIVAGPENGPKARPTHPDVFRSIRDQCQAAGVPFFFKGWGNFRPLGDADPDAAEFLPAVMTADLDKTVMVYRDGRSNSGNTPPTEHGAWFMEPVGKKAAGRLLDGREWNEMPEMLKLEAR
jgi:protein gp37